MGPGAPRVSRSQPCPILCSAMEKAEELDTAVRDLAFLLSRIGKDWVEILLFFFFSFSFLKKKKQTVINLCKGFQQSFGVREDSQAQCF